MQKVDVPRCPLCVAFLFNNYFHVCKMQKSLICNLSLSFNAQLCICRERSGRGGALLAAAHANALGWVPALTTSLPSATAAARQRNTTTFTIKFCKTFELRRHLRFALPAVGATSRCQLHSLLNAFQRRG